MMGAANATAGNGAAQEFTVFVPGTRLRLLVRILPSVRAVTDAYPGGRRLSRPAIHGYFEESPWVCRREKPRNNPRIGTMVLAAPCPAWLVSHESVHVAYTLQNLRPRSDAEEFVATVTGELTKRLLDAIAKHRARPGSK